MHTRVMDRLRLLPCCNSLVGRHGCLSLAVAHMTLRSWLACFDYLVFGVDFSGFLQIFGTFFSVSLVCFVFIAFLDRSRRVDVDRVPIEMSKNTNFWHRKKLFYLYLVVC
jgi:hypothetical protein